ncbi:MAG: DUF4253 domain-containing protein [Gemmataceae bacterium]
MKFTTRKIPGSEALQILIEQRQRFPKTGHYPFLIGEADEIARINDASNLYQEEPAAIIQKSLAINMADWMANRQSELQDDGMDAEEILGEWPRKKVGHGSIRLHTDVLTGEVMSEIYMGFAKIKEPWHWAAAIKWGGWNDCPLPEIHCAIHRDWQNRFGAEVTGVSSVVVECIVRKPPQDRAGAIALAWEQYWYCPDIVEQGCVSISNLAASLLDSPYWFFWWD